jgi:hypothetical protein
MTRMISFSSPFILFYSFVIFLIVSNNDFVYPFSVQCNRYRFLSRSQFISMPRNSVMQINSDNDDYGGEDSDSKIFDDDVGEDILEDEIIEVEDDDEEDDEEQDEEEKLDSEGNPIAISWQDRRQYMNAERDRKAAAVRAKLSWEEKFEDDPLRADTPTKPFDQDIEPDEKFFVAIGDVLGADMLSKRSRAWVHHMQWARRSALLPTIDAKIKWEYTRLSQDCMGPIGQVMGIKANTSAQVRQLLETEPLTVTGGISPWKLFEFNQFDHDNTTWDLHDPRMFIGFDSEGKSKSSEQYEKLEEAHQDYHIAGGRTTIIGDDKKPVQQPVLNHKRASMMGRLMPCDDEESTTNGTFILFNAKTNADAERYIALDPLMKAVYDEKNSLISPINEQDIDGLHHMMARTFGQKTVLDQVCQA